MNLRYGLSRNKIEGGCMDKKIIKDFVKERYSAIARTRGSCCPSCGDSGDFSEIGKKIGYSKDDLRNVPEAANMGMGCGNPVAFASFSEGDIVLDLGSGGGIDVFLAAKKVGARGKVIGVDISEAMVERAATIAARYGYGNVEFRVGEIENLPVVDEAVDVVVSNCVINLSTDKERVFQEAYRVLKHKGRLMISDIVTEGELPEDVRRNPEAWACCIGGALEKSQYIKCIERAGFRGVRVVSEAVYDGGVPKGLAGKIVSVKIEAYKE